MHDVQILAQAGPISFVHDHDYRELWIRRELDDGSFEYLHVFPESERWEANVAFARASARWA